MPCFVLYVLYVGTGALTLRASHRSWVTCFKRHLTPNTALWSFRTEHSGSSSLTSPALRRFEEGYCQAAELFSYLFFPAALYLAFIFKNWCYWLALLHRSFTQWASILSLSNFRSRTGHECTGFQTGNSRRHSRISHVSSLWRRWRRNKENSDGGNWKRNQRSSSVWGCFNLDVSSSVSRSLGMAEQTTGCLSPHAGCRQASSYLLCRMHFTGA